MAALCPRWFKRQVVEELIQQRRLTSGAVEDMANAAGVGLESALAQDQGQLKAEQLVERQPPPGRFALGHRGRLMDVVKRPGSVDELESAPPASRKRFGKGPSPLECLAQELGDASRREVGLLGQGVDGIDPSSRTAVVGAGAATPVGFVLIVGPARGADHLDRRVHHLAAVADEVPSFPKNNASVPTGSCLARQAWLKNTTLEPPVPSVMSSSTRVGPRR